MSKEATIFVSGEPLEIKKTEVRYIPQMEYYYRRRNKYFLRTKDGFKISFETDKPQAMPKRGSFIDCEFTLE